jgi:hypothetical protein
MDKGDIELGRALPNLARSEKLQALLLREFGLEQLKIILQMMRAGRFEGSIGDDLHDYPVDEIDGLPGVR